MGPATATAIIKRRIDKHIINEYGIDELTNTGRYYIARVSEANGITNESESITFSPPLPKTFALHQNYPNPFNPSTTIQFSLPTASNVKIEIFDLLGNTVKMVVDAEYDDITPKALGSGQKSLGQAVTQSSDDFYRKMKINKLLIPI